MLADVTRPTGGQAIKGDQDVALLKYDSAGKLIYTRTLGAAGRPPRASGWRSRRTARWRSAGSVTGALTAPSTARSIPAPRARSRTNTDSFVTLYDANGDEVWTERRGARLDDQASQVAFGADGTVYVAGQAQGQMPGPGAADRRLRRLHRGLHDHGQRARRRRPSPRPSAPPARTSRRAWWSTAIR